MCTHGFMGIIVTAAQNIPRKLLRQPSMNDAKIEDDPCKNMGIHGHNQDDNDSLEGQDHLLAVPGVILLCCGLMIPCFHAEKKEVSRHNTTSIQRNAGESTHHEYLALYYC